MKKPNSRKGRSTLAKFAKKLAEVVIDVAAQLFIPFAKVQDSLE
jgi:hypothetical protein